jgi:H+/gluconate symporter-like permease
MPVDDLASLASAISIVLGVLTYFLTMVIESSGKVLAVLMPSKDQDAARKKLRKSLARSLFSSALPMLTAFALLFYLCLPTTVIISHSSNLQLWNFDLLKTIFVFLELAIAACLILSIIVAAQLLWRIWLTLKA